MSAAVDWAAVGDALDREGCAILVGAWPLTATGPGPDVDRFATEVRTHLLPIADRWMALLGRDCRFAPVAEVASNLTHLAVGAFVPLHRPVDESAFPMRLVAVLNRPGEDFTGGDFIVTEQRPRMQSRPMVVPLRPGDVAIVAAGRRPHRVAKGHHAVVARHGIGRVRSGERIGLEIVLGAAQA